MARVTGTTHTSLGFLIVSPTSSGVSQLNGIQGKVLIQSDGTYDFQLQVGIYDISVYDRKNIPQTTRRGVTIRITDSTITLEGLLERL